MRAADPRLQAGVALLLATAVGVALALGAGVAGVSAVPAVLRTAAVGVVLFALSGYAAARLLVSGELTVHRALLILPLGATISSLLLAVLGLLHVPLKVSLAVVIVVAALAAGLSVARGVGVAHRPSARLPTDRSLITRVALPFALAAVIASISLIPIFRSGFATVPGQNGDAVLVVGSAVLLERAPPTANRADLPINHIPLQWRSKYPIYYALAGIATLAGQDPIHAFATVSALMLALTVLGFFLFARYVLRAPPWVALLSMFLVPLDRIVMYVTIHPYYNELWGQFALPFVLLCGVHFLRSPGRRSAILFALFAALGLLAYPLMVPFPAIFLGVFAWVTWRRRRAEGQRVAWISALRIPRPGVRSWLWVPVLVIGVPVALVLVRGFFEKTLSALAVFAPWTSLSGWSGTALSFLPWPRFVGMPAAGLAGAIGLAIVAALAALALRRMRSDARWPMAAMIVVMGLIGLYFRERTGGQLFFFKDLAFLGPYVLMLAVIGLCGLVMSARRSTVLVGAVGLAGALVVVPLSAAREINSTYDQANPSVLALRGWDRALPRGTSVRIDVPPTGYQLWTTYMFSDHPLSALNPLAGFFPHPPAGRKADYVIALRSQGRPRDAIGPVLFANEQFQMWRMNPSVAGPDVSSRWQLDIKKIVIGL